MKRTIFDQLNRRLSLTRWNFFNPYAHISYSQEGEDLILQRMFENQANGFYIDIGAHHPIRFSNTFAFYRKGWNGINIDAMPGSMRLFDKMRPLDLNIEAGIGRNEGTMSFYMFDEPALNSFSKEISHERVQNTAYRIKNIKPVSVFPLWRILDKHLKPKQQIDFLSVDVEGLELEVLQSNNWSKYKPMVIVTESLDIGISELQKSEIHVFLRQLGYSLNAKTCNTSFYNLASSQAEQDQV